MNMPLIMQPVGCFVVNPLGWLVLGATGYLIYQAGKKAGNRPSERSTEKLPKAKTQP